MKINTKMKAFISIVLIVLGYIIGYTIGYIVNT